MHALWIANAITRALGLSAHSVPLSFVYRHPSIESLTRFTLGLAGGKTANCDGTAARVDRMKELARRFSYDGRDDLRMSAPHSGVGSGGKDVIIVTGTTGALGSSILAKLVGLQEVEHVYAFNRRAQEGRTVLERQQDAFAKRSLDVGIASSSKVTLLEVEYERAGFGLGEEVLEKLRGVVTHILHIGTTFVLRPFLIVLTSFCSMACQFQLGPRCVFGCSKWCTKSL